MPDTQPRYLPLYQQIRQTLAQRIARGDWPLDHALPNEWDLAEALGVSQGTVRKALGELTREGWLYRVQGRGTFVAPISDEWGGGQLVGPGQFTARGEAVVAELLSLARVNAALDVAQVLGVRRGAPLYCCRLLWRAGSESVALDEVLLSVERVSPLNARVLRACHSSVYRVLAQHDGLRLRIRASQFRAVLPSRADAQLLHSAPDEPLLSILRVGETFEGEAIEWRQRLCRSLRWAMQM